MEQTMEENKLLPTDPEAVVQDIISILEAGLPGEPPQIERREQWSGPYVSVKIGDVEHEITPMEDYGAISCGPHNTNLVKCLMESGYSVHGSDSIRYA